MNRRSVLAMWLDRIAGAIFALSGHCLSYFKTASERHYVRLIEWTYVKSEDGYKAVRTERTISMTLEEAMQDARAADSFSLLYIDRRGDRDGMGWHPNSYVYREIRTKE